MSVAARTLPGMADQTTLDEDGVPPGARPVPARITTALNARDLYGPDVDKQVGTWEGNPAGDVDDWEAGAAAPDRQQVRWLAALCELPVAYFYQPLTDAERNTVVFICGRSGPRGGGRRVCRRVVGPPSPPADGDPTPDIRQGTLF